MMALLLLLLVSGLGAACAKRKLEEVLPVSLAVLMLLLYGISILGLAARAVLLVNAVWVLLSLVLFMIFFRKSGTLGELLSVYQSPGVWIYLCLAAAMFFLFRTHIVTNWDDLNYWAMFPRNMYEVSGLPAGSSSCTLFKDYSPIVQILYYYGFKLTGHFSESMMFAINNILLYTFLLPFFQWKKGERLRNIILIITGVIFPCIAMFQQLHCLGVDCIMGVLFGYLLWEILHEKTRGWFCFLQIAVMSSTLILMKSAAVLFVVITLLVLLVSWEHLSVKRFLLSAGCYLPAVAGYFSWILFCRLRGNYSYLTQRVSANVQNPGAMQLPEYTASTVMNFLLAFLRTSLNDGVIGLSPFAILLLGLVALLARRKVAGLTKGQIRAVWVLAAGMVVYSMSLLYIYLFVFDPWEAESLSSFDRYIGIYTTAVLYLALLSLEKRNTARIFVPVAALMTITLNFGFLGENFLPEQYAADHQASSAARTEMEERFRSLKEAHPEIQGRRILLWSQEENQGRDKYAQYAAVPNVTEVYAGDAAGAREKAVDRNMDFIYHMDSNSLEKVE